MVFELFRGAGESQVEAIEEEIATMLATSGETFRMALDALTRRTDPAKIGKTLRKRDRSINKVERAIRRRQIGQAGGRGALAGAAVLFVFGSSGKGSGIENSASPAMHRLVAPTIVHVDQGSSSTAPRITCSR